MSTRLALPLLLLCLAGCQSVRPSAADQALVRQYDDLEAELFDSVAWDTFLHTRQERFDRYRQQMRQRQAMSPQDLEAARRYFLERLDLLPQVRHWPQPLTIDVPKAATAPVIDGAGGDPAWQGSAPIAIQYQANQSSAQPAPPATCRLLWDEQCLYALFEVADAQLMAPPLPRDGPVFLHDCVELFLQVEPRFMQHWELNVSPSGSVFDALVYKYSDRYSAHFRSDENVQGLRVSVRVIGTLNHDADRDEGYVVELALPWSQLPGMAQGPRAGQTVYGLLGLSQRDSAAGAPTYYAHTPTFGGFHNARNYSPMTLRPAP